MIFISYRRDDSRHITERIYDRLVAEFGPDSVFKDIDSIPLGADFRKVLEATVSRCRVFLAVIGNRWVTITKEDGSRRLDDPDDFVRVEVEGALAGEQPLIPVLVDLAKMPSGDQLPPTLLGLPF